MIDVKALLTEDIGRPVYDSESQKIGKLYGTIYMSNLAFIEIMVKEITSKNDSRVVFRDIILCDPTECTLMDEE